MKHRDDIWYATVIEMVDYMNASRALKIAVSGNFAENPTARLVWLSVDGNIVKIPAGGIVTL